MTNVALILLVFSFFLRLTYSLFIHSPSSFLHSDIAIYHGIADQILQGNWAASHFFQPVGFPLLLAGIKLLPGDWGLWLGALQAIAGTWTLAILWSLTRERWGDKVGHIVLVFGTLHVPWVLYTGYAFGETFYTLLLAILLYFSVRVFRHPLKSATSLLWGATFMFSFWIKGQHAFFLPLFCLGLLWTYKRLALRPVALISLVVVLGFAAHGTFSHHKTGKIKLSADTGGLNLVEGKCPSKKNTDPSGLTWWSPLFHGLHMDQHKKWERPFSDSGYYMKEGFKCIARNPWVMVQSIEYVPYLFFGNSLWPVYWQPIGQKVRLYEAIFAVFAISGLLLFFLQCGMRKDQEELLVWVLPILSLFLLVYVFKSEIRYRVPFDVFILPLSVQGWHSVLLALRRHHEFSSSSEDLLQELRHPGVETSERPHLILEPEEVRTL